MSQDILNKPIKELTIDEVTEAIKSIGELIGGLSKLNRVDFEFPIHCQSITRIPELNDVRDSLHNHRERLSLFAELGATYNTDLTGKTDKEVATLIFESIYSKIDRENNPAETSDFDVIKEMLPANSIESVTDDQPHKYIHTTNDIAFEFDKDKFKLTGVWATK